MLARGDELLTSFLTVGEVIAKPKQLNNSMLEGVTSTFSRVVPWN